MMKGYLSSWLAKGLGRDIGGGGGYVASALLISQFGSWALLKEQVEQVSRNCDHLNHLEI